MKIKTVSKTLGLTLAAIASVSMAACSRTPLPDPGASGEVPVVQEETQTVIQEEHETLIPEETTETKEATRAIEETIAERFEGADYIEAISETRFVVLYRGENHYKAEVNVYDVTTDTVINTFTVYSGDWFVKPVIFEGSGFGFISEREGIKNHGVDASFYDLDGNLVNKFSKDFDNDLFASFALAPDGSALYVSLNDNIVCACGYSFKADYTTKIYAVYGDGTESLIKEFDSHTDLSILGVSDDGKIVVNFKYDPNEKEVHTHEEWERLYFSAIPEEDSNKEKVVRGYAFLDPNAGEEQELERFYETDKYYEHVFLRGNSLILVSHDEIIKVSFDENGDSEETKFETFIGAEGYYFDLYVSASGDYVVYPSYTDEFKDTTVNVLKITDGEAELVYSEFFEGKKIEIDPDCNLAILDEETGDLYGLYDETVSGGLRRQTFYVNIFE